jgi:hypothetical protein
MLTCGARSLRRMLESINNRPPRAIIRAGAGTASKARRRGAIHPFKIDYYDANM